MSSRRLTAKQVHDANFCPDCGKLLFLHLFGKRCRDEPVLTTTLHAKVKQRRSSRKRHK